mmetsp:Transcript_1778/g.5895  ORF Transcript_1778/g.5895 Transcript_1778/m.5895 type:complete len:204 (-) Transcript_1778:325-936(-)
MLKLGRVGEIGVLHRHRQHRIPRLPRWPLIFPLRPPRKFGQILHRLPAQLTLRQPAPAVVLDLGPLDGARPVSHRQIPTTPAFQRHTLARLKLRLGQRLQTDETHRIAGNRAATGLVLHVTAGDGIHPIRRAGIVQCTRAITSNRYKPIPYTQQSTSRGALWLDLLGHHTSPAGLEVPNSVQLQPGRPHRVGRRGHRVGRRGL